MSASRGAREVIKTGAGWSRRIILAAAVTALLLWGAAGDYRPTPIDLAVAPYRYSVVEWELSHFADKWFYKVGSLLPWNSESPRQERAARVLEYFAVVEEVQHLERELLAGSEGETAGLRSRVRELNEQRRRLQPEVEETIESEITAVMVQEGFGSRIGGIFPPVDTVFARSPGVLVLSPRDRIFRQGSSLLRPGIGNQERDELESLILEEQDLAALVEDTGGVAAYPSVVAASGNFHWTVITVAHEWLHHWFHFQPLGQHFWDTPEMTTLNETAAVLGGEAIGDRVFTAITGEDFHREPPSPEQERKPEPDPDAFDFAKEMRETRLATEALLAEGKIEEAEAYMEARRLLFVQNGHNIRKINQAYFAFHGSYATSPASVSPIEGQLRDLRARARSLGEFIRTVASFSSYEEFAAEAGRR